MIPIKALSAHGKTKGSDFRIWGENNEVKE